MMLGSVLFILDRPPENRDYSWFLFTPGEHFVMVRSDGSDLEESFARLRADPARARRMATAMHKRAVEVFNPREVYKRQCIAIRNWSDKYGLMPTDDCD